MAHLARSAALDAWQAATAAERQRCAAIARTLRTVIDDVSVAREDIAQAIEEGTKP